MNNSPKILVVGDAMIDRYWVGRAERISPEAPIPVVKIEKVFDCPGGADNVAKNLKLLGCRSTLRAGFGRPIKNRLMVGDHQLARWDEKDVVEPIVYASVYLPFDAIVISDYAKGSITPSVIYNISLLGLPTFIDTKRSPKEFEAIKDATFFPNLKECAEFEDQYNACQTVVLKCGAGGIQLRRKELEDVDINGLDVSPKSVNGAGDVVIASYVATTLEGYRPEDAAEIANLYAGKAVARHQYTVTVEGVFDDELRTAA